MTPRAWCRAQRKRWDSPRSCEFRGACQTGCDPHPVLGWVGPRLPSLVSGFEMSPHLHGLVRVTDYTLRTYRLCSLPPVPDQRLNHAGRRTPHTKPCDAGSGCLAAQSVNPSANQKRGCWARVVLYNNRAPVTQSRTFQLL
ncbi:hypothetical protein PoB_002978800 [Plakobranchus ocellatus]|uniref:Uncharacterized protein n=1 Tax=Plakobranchus ocellatus TaxID=259542 RepID=A0AAV4A9G9_9GAST|nr:hypothetical protein PoB_002978800 [Plakobranchus ocellatus]